MSRSTSAILSPTQKALKTATWARTMTKWLITHSSKDGAKWQLVEFNGPNGQESGGIVDLIAIRKNHKKPEDGGYKGDLFEIVLIQVKGGSASFPTGPEIARLLHVRKHHQADRVVLAEWKKTKKLCLYEWGQVEAKWDPVHKAWDPVTAKWKQVNGTEIFGKVPKGTKNLPASISLSNIDPSGAKTLNVQASQEAASNRELSPAEKSWVTRRHNQALERSAGQVKRGKLL